MHPHHNIKSHTSPQARFHLTHLPSFLLFGIPKPPLPGSLTFSWHDQRWKECRGWIPSPKLCEHVVNFDVFGHWMSLVILVPSFVERCAKARNDSTKYITILLKSLDIKWFKWYQWGTSLGASFSIQRSSNGQPQIPGAWWAEALIGNASIELVCQGKVKTHNVPQRLEGKTQNVPNFRVANEKYSNIRVREDLTTECVRSVRIMHTSLYALSFLQLAARLGSQTSFSSWDHALSPHKHLHWPIFASHHHPPPEVSRPYNWMAPSNLPFSFKSLRWISWLQLSLQMFRHALNGVVSFEVAQSKRHY